MHLLISLGSLLILVNTVLADCPSGYERHDNSCYKILGLEASWAEAKMYCRFLGSRLLHIGGTIFQMYCRFLGSDLAIINSAAEETAIEGMLTHLHGGQYEEVYWLSATDMLNEGQFVWISGDGQMAPITNYTNWAPGAPDNMAGNQNCLKMVYKKGGDIYWQDAFCQGQHSFICERSAGPEASEIVG